MDNYENSINKDIELPNLTEHIPLTTKDSELK